MSVFEVVTLASVALGGALVLAVSQARIHAHDALYVHVLLGAFLTGLLAFYVPIEQVLRYGLAMDGIPLAAKLIAYLFGQQLVYPVYAPYPNDQPQQPVQGAYKSHTQ